MQLELENKTLKTVFTKNEKVAGGHCFECGDNKLIISQVKIIEPSAMLVSFVCLACGMKDTAEIDSQDFQEMVG